MDEAFMHYLNTKPALTSDVPRNIAQLMNVTLQSRRRSARLAGTPHRYNESICRTHVDAFRWIGGPKAVSNVPSDTPTCAGNCPAISASEKAPNFLKRYGYGQQTRGFSIKLAEW